MGLRLFLPESWTDDPERMSAGRGAGGPPGCPDASRRSRSTEIDRVWPPGAGSAACWPMPATAVSAPFRQALSARGLPGRSGIPRRQKVYPADVALIFPAAGPASPASTTSRTAPRPAEAMLAGRAWRTLSWRTRHQGAG